ncbi:hypothetical protein FOMPIDRAFT_99402 [Fomitopsis schrenkii]|uniref:SprT-like domain-containing protein n=1 Tax=Fomitopsis schrenkii TaxID=2126942 RepID=S8FMR3_FOMSC|nr:hypothetical protein FOMPIDRAFT_99402 [Fomitopsis schrenkii]
MSVDAMKIYRRASVGDRDACTRPWHKVALRVGFDVSLLHSGVGSMRAMRIHVSDDEVVPDSEEERLQRRKANKRGELADGANPDVIVLSSDEDEDECIPVRRPVRARRVVESSDSEDPEDKRVERAKTSAQVLQPRPSVTTRPAEAVIDLTVSSDESDSVSAIPKNTRRVPAKPAHKPAARATTSQDTSSSPGDENKFTIPLFADDPDDDDDDDDPMNMDDGSILVLNEPRSARKPLRTTNLSYPARAVPSASLPTTPVRRIVSVHSTDSEPESDTDGESQASAPVRNAKPASQPKKAGSAAKAPRLTKKALEAAEQQRRERYAQTFFDEINRTVFDGGLPGDTKLEWNKRLLSTAGRAKWQRDREGVQTTMIELAIKILTSEERIRNTLSHEMCHLACWIISEKPTESHGSIFKTWARKVMEGRPDVEVTTKHSYEIDYKYQWKCEKCDKIYGRFSKSIKPEACVCSACKEGRLIPLFPTTPRAPKTPKSKAASALASAKGRDSPLAVASPVLVSEGEVFARTDIRVPHATPTRAWKAKRPTQKVPGAFLLADDRDEDEDDGVDEGVRVLTRVLEGVRL